MNLCIDNIIGTLVRKCVTDEDWDYKNTCDVIDGLPKIQHD